MSISLEDLIFPAPPAEVQEDLARPREHPATQNRGKTIENGGRQASPLAKRAFTHDLLIDFMLSNPGATNAQIAEAHGFKSPQSISIIINSDAFQARLSKRKDEVLDPLVVASLNDRFKLLASQAAENIAAKLTANPQDGKFALDVMRESGKLAGYGIANKDAPTIQASFVVALPGPAANAQEWSARFAAPEAQVVVPRVDQAPSEA